MISALHAALAGLRRAEERFATAAEAVARGPVDEAAVIDAKTAALDVKLQSRNLKAAADREKDLIDLLA